MSVDLQAVVTSLQLVGPLPVLGLIVIMSLWSADGVVTAESKTAFGQKSQSFWRFEVLNLRFMADLVDHLYRTRAHYRPSIKRFAIVSPIVFIIVFILVFTYFAQDGTKLAPSGPVYLINAMVVAIVVNYVTDYLSVWKARWLMSKTDGRAIRVIGLAIVDLLVSLVLLIVGAALGNMIVVLVVMPLFMFGVIEAPSPDLVFNGELTYNAIIGASVILSSLVTSSLYILYTASLMILGTISFLGRVLRPIIPFLDFQHVPLRINGTLTGLLLILGGAAQKAAESIHL